MDIPDELLKHSEKEYGKDCREHVVEIYKLYVDMADRISSRRQTANSFFLTLNTALVGIVGYTQLGLRGSDSMKLLWIISIGGITLCFSWYRLLRSYRGLSSGKFAVIQAIERQLPISPYAAEWEALGRGEDPERYLPFTKVEVVVPWVFLVLHFIVFFRAFPWDSIWKWISSVPT